MSAYHLSVLEQPGVVSFSLTMTEEYTHPCFFITLPMFPFCLNMTYMSPFGSVQASSIVPKKNFLMYDHPLDYEARFLCEAREDFVYDCQRTADAYNRRCKRSAEIMVEYFIHYYPFFDNLAIALKKMVLKELDEILRQRDYSHKALNDMQQRNIDWLAAPLFKAMWVNLCLSDLCKEYDMYRYDSTYQLSADCHKCFYISCHDEDSSVGRGKERERRE
jgi:hypothetical protein